MSEVISPSLPATQEQATIVLPHRVEEITKEILQQKDQIVCSFIQIGKLLDEAKGRLKKDGQWLKWLDTSVDISVRTAQRCIQLARAFPDATSVTHLGMTKALALLALPEAQRDSFIAAPHEINGSQKQITDMSVRELKSVIRQQTNPLDKANNVIMESAEAAKDIINSDMVDTSMKFKPLYRKDVTPKPEPLPDPLTDIKRAQIHLDGILKALESQPSDGEVRNMIADELDSLHQKVVECLRIVKTEAQSD